MEAGKRYGRLQCYEKSSVVFVSKYVLYTRRFSIVQLKRYLTLRQAWTGMAIARDFFRRQ